MISPTKRVIFRRNLNPGITNSPQKLPTDDDIQQPQINRSKPRLNQQFDPFEKEKLTEQQIERNSLQSNDIRVDNPNNSGVPFVRNRTNPLTALGFSDDFQEPGSPRATFPVMSRAKNGSISDNKIDPALPAKEINSGEYDKYLAYNKKGILSKYPAKKLQTIAKMMGGPQNFSKHYGLVPYEINQIFPPINKAKGKPNTYTASNPTSRATSPGFIPPTPSSNKPQRYTRKPQVYSTGQEQLDDKHKLIFYPIPQHLQKSKNG